MVTASDKQLHCIQVLDCALFWQHCCGIGRTGLHKWPDSALCLPGMPSSAITSWTVNPKGGKLGEMMEAKGESEEGENAFWFIFKDASYCIFNHLPRCGGTPRQIAERLNSYYWVNSLRRLKLGVLFPALSLSLTLLFYHSSFPSLQGAQKGSLPRNCSAVWMLTWSAKCFNRQGIWQSSPLVLQSLAVTLSHPILTDRFPLATLFYDLIKLFCNLDKDVHQ